MEVQQQEVKKEEEVFKGKITVYCTCGEVYTKEFNQIIVCPKCNQRPVLLWNKEYKAHRFFGITK